jgi:hypothetical protein
VLWPKVTPAGDVDGFCAADSTSATCSGLILGRAIITLIVRSAPLGAGRGSVGSEEVTRRPAEM